MGPEQIIQEHSFNKTWEYIQTFFVNKKKKNTRTTIFEVQFPFVIHIFAGKQGKG